MCSATWFLAAAKAGRCSKENSGFGTIFPKDATKLVTYIRHPTSPEFSLKPEHSKRGQTQKQALFLHSREPGINRKIPNLNRKIPNLNRRMPDLKRKIPSLNREIPSLKRKIPELNCEMPDLNCQIPSLNREIPNLNRKIPDLNRKIPNLNCKITKSSPPAAAFQSAFSTISSLPPCIYGLSVLFSGLLFLGRPGIVFSARRQVASAFSNRLNQTDA